MILLIWYLIRIDHCSTKMQRRVSLIKNFYHGKVTMLKVGADTTTASAASASIQNTFEAEAEFGYPQPFPAEPLHVEELLSEPLTSVWLETFQTPRRDGKIVQPLGEKNHNFFNVHD
jgi:hypothetical protein